MFKKILLTVAYDGSRYYGFQKQPEITRPTVQKSLEDSLAAFFKQPVACLASSRTDRGVHAFGQRATIEVDTTVPAENLTLALLPFLPEDISIVEAVEVEKSFHPRYDCVSKKYEYKIYNSRYRNPVYRNFSEFIRNELDIIAMHEAAQHLVGTHDFKAFAASGGSVKTTVRTIFSISVEEKGEFIVVSVTGSGFLYNMVRIIAGTLIMVGEGKIAVNEVADILESLDRTKAGSTAGPQGLTLVNISY